MSFTKARIRAPAVGSTRLVVVWLGLILTVGGFNQNAHAQDKGYCWKDSKTGQIVPSYPYGADRESDPNRAFVRATGKNFVRDQDGTWRDSSTGQAVPDYPYGADRESDPNRAFVRATGKNFVRVPCPPTSAKSPTPSVKSRGKTVSKQQTPGDTTTPSPEVGRAIGTGIGLGIGIGLGGGFGRGGADRIDSPATMSPKSAPSVPKY